MRHSNEKKNVRIHYRQWCNFMLVQSFSTRLYFKKSTLLWCLAFVKCTDCTFLQFLYENPKNTMQCPIWKSNRVGFVFDPIFGYFEHAWKHQKSWICTTEMPAFMAYKCVPAVSRTIKCTRTAFQLARNYPCKMQ